MSSTSYKKFDFRNWGQLSITVSRQSDNKYYYLAVLDRQRLNTSGLADSETRAYIAAKEGIYQQLQRKLKSLLAEVDLINKTCGVVDRISFDD